MIYGPWAMTHASRLLIHGPGSNNLSKIFFSLLLGAWCLWLVACGLLLAACNFFPVSMGHGPRFMELVDFSAWRPDQGRRILKLGPGISVSHMSRWVCLETSTHGSSCTCRPDQAPDMSCSSLKQLTSTATMKEPGCSPWLLILLLINSLV